MRQVRTILICLSKRDAFFIAYEWDGTEEGKNLVIPDEFNGVPVTRLGGYTGTGFPWPFSGKNVESLYYYNGENEYYQFTTEGQPTKLYKAVYLFELTEDNSTFYSANGVLYEKSTGEPAEWGHGN